MAAAPLLEDALAFDLWQGWGCTEDSPPSGRGVLDSQDDTLLLGPFLPQTQPLVMALWTCGWRLCEVAVTDPHALLLPVTTGYPHGLCC